MVFNLGLIVIAESVRIIVDLDNVDISIVQLGPRHWFITQNG